MGSTRFSPTDPDTTHGPDRDDTRSQTGEEQADRVAGGDAEKPTEIPARGWFQIVKRGWAEAKTDQVPLLGAGVAFYAFLALFPALIALVTLYGLFADPGVIAEQVNALTALPAEVRQLIVDQINNQNQSALGWAAILSIALALFSASGGVNNLITAVNVAYDEDDERSFVKKRLLALALTLGAIVFLMIMLGLVAVVPPLLQNLLGDSPVVQFLLLAARWVLLVVPGHRRLGGAVPGGTGPGRPEDAVGLRWGGGGHSPVAARLDRVLGVRVDLRQLRQDLRGVRGHHRAAVLAVDHLLRDLARR